MRVALISHEGGGISSVCHGLAQSLAKKKIDTTIFEGKPACAHKTERLNDYLEITRLPILNFPPKPLWFQILNIRKLFKVIDNFTVIHGVSPNASFAFTFYKRKPFVATIHGCPRVIQKVFVSSPISCWTLGDFGLQIMEFPLHDFAISRILSTSDHIAVCSFTVLEELKTYKSLDSNKVSVIYNGINFNEVENIKVSSTDDKGDLSIIYAGRLFWTKGVMFLLEAFKLVRQNFRNVHLNVFGKGPLEKKIREFIVSSGLKDEVHYRGYVPRKKLLAEVKKSDVVVLPSLYEAQPMFALEAMACKKPLVVFDVPYTRELIFNMVNGLTAEVHNIKDLSNKIQLLLSDRNLRIKLGENAYNYIKQTHNWDVQVEKYLEVYEKIK